MIYSYEKYNSIEDFVNNKPKCAKPYSIAKKCDGFDFEELKYTDRCFGCAFCVFDTQNYLEKFKDKWGADFFWEYSNLSFSGALVDMPNSNGIRCVNNLERFTAIDETANIQPWAAGIINHTCSCNNRISMEIPVPNSNYDRPGRLDIGSITENGYLIVIETKTKLDDALSDERFVEQKDKYSEIEKYIKNYSYLTMLGGKETDLLPDSHCQCSGRVGEKTKRFYSLIEDNGIRFISANALWCMCCKYMNGETSFAWDIFLKTVFSDDCCVGLLSAGKIVKQNNDYQIVSVK